MKNTIIIQLLKRAQEKSPEFYKKIRKYCFWLAAILSVVYVGNLFFGFGLGTIIILQTNLLAIIVKILVILGTCFGFSFVPVKTDKLAKVRGIEQSSFVKIKGSDTGVKVARVEDEKIILANGIVEHLDNVKKIKTSRKKMKVKFKK